MARFPWQLLPFQLAIEYFLRKRPIDTDTWKDSIDLDHNAYFAVAGAKGALLSDIYREVQKAIEQGTSIDQFRREFGAIVERNGWQPRGGKDWRARTIYESNLRTAYANGRYQQLQAVKQTRPYWQWRHGGSRNPRPSHLALNGRVFSSDDLLFQGGFPPIGWGCKCQIYALGQRDMERDGLSVEVAPEIGSIVGGEVFQPDPGWGQVGKTPEQKQALYKTVTDGMVPSIGQQVLNDMANYRKPQP